MEDLRVILNMCRRSIARSASGNDARRTAPLGVGVRRKHLDYRHRGATGKRMNKKLQTFRGALELIILPNTTPALFHFPSAACAAASLAMGTRKGLQLT
jgi:hypothetical protein